MKVNYSLMTDAMQRFFSTPFQTKLRFPAGWSHSFFLLSLGFLLILTQKKFFTLWPEHLNAYEP